MSALERFIYVGLLRKWPGPKHRVRLNQVSALEGVRFNQVSLYFQLDSNIDVPLKTLLRWTFKDTFNWAVT